MKAKFKISDLYTLREALLAALDLKGKTFAKVLQSNIRLVDETLQRERQKFEIEHRLSKEATAYMEGQQSLLAKYAEKGTGGGVVRDDIGKPVVKRVDSYNKEYKALQKKYPKAEEEIKKRHLKYGASLTKEVEIDFNVLKREKYIPENITARQRMVLSFMFHKRLQV